MATPKPVAEWLDYLRGMFRRVTIASGPEVIQNARVGLQNVNSLVVPSAPFRAASASLLDRVTELFAVLNSPDLLTDPARLDRPKAAAVAAVQDLENALAGARPSENAIALGLDW